MSRGGLCVRISDCWRLFLSTCGERLTVNFSILVGSGIGPRTCAPVRLAVLTISRVDASRMRWSNALSRMRMFWPFMMLARETEDGRRIRRRVRSLSSFLRPLFLCRPSLDDLRHHAGADRAAALAD